MPYNEVRVLSGFLGPPDQRYKFKKGSGFASPSPFKGVGKYHGTEPGKLTKI